MSEGEVQHPVPAAYPAEGGLEREDRRVGNRAEEQESQVEALGRQPARLRRRGTHRFQLRVQRLLDRVRDHAGEEQPHGPGW